MAKFFGVVGYGHAEESSSAAGVFEDVITERQYYGDVITNTRRLDDRDKVLPDISVNNSISIVADAYADENFFAIRYVAWARSLWTVTEVEVKRPRLLLRLGGVYNGPTA